MHKQNKVPLSVHPHLESGFYATEPHYQSKVDGSDTTDITEALLDYDGNPLVVDFKATTKIMAEIANPPKPLTLSPSDPISRAQCFEVFGMLNKRPSSPISMVDKIEAHGYAERVSCAISRSLQSAVNSATSSPSPSPSNNDNNEQPQA